MKIREMLSLVLVKKTRKRTGIIQKKLFYNNVELKKIHVWLYHNPHRMYKMLREIKNLKEQNAFFIRNKRGFNTILFQTNFDIVIADRNGKILDLFRVCDTNFTSNHYANGYYVFFFPLGAINYYKFQKDSLLTVGIKILKNLEYVNRF